MVQWFVKTWPTSISNQNAMQRFIPNWHHKIVEQCTNILILAVNGYVQGIEVNAWYIDMVDIQMIISFKKGYPSHIKQKEKEKINNIVMAYIKYDDTRTTPYS
jgi:hypothetical protein